MQTHHLLLQLFLAARSDNVIQRFARCWDFHQADGALPHLLRGSTHRLGRLLYQPISPDNGRSHDPVAINQTLSGCVGVSIELQFSRIIQRTANPLPLPRHMDRRSES